MSSPLALVEHPRFLDHAAAGHPERPDRLRAIAAAISAHPGLRDLPRLDIEPAGDAMLELAHTPDHIAGLRALAAGGGGWIDADTYCTPESEAIACLAAGGAVAGCDAVLESSARHVMALLRPPGHHATRDEAMGFCLYNNAAIAVRHAQQRGVSRIAILDIDVHHGNGTEEIFWDDAGVLYVSLHQAPLYPGTGGADRRGAHDNVVNIPLPPGTGGDAWLGRFEERALTAVRDFAPGLIVVSAGYDGHEADPLAGLRLTSTTYGAVAGQVARLCDDGGIGSLWTLEGGYDLEALAASVIATLEPLAGIETAPVEAPS